MPPNRLSKIRSCPRKLLNQAVAVSIPGLVELIQHRGNLQKIVAELKNTRQRYDFRPGYEWMVVGRGFVRRSIFNKARATTLMLRDFVGGSRQHNKCFQKNLS